MCFTVQAVAIPKFVKEQPQILLLRLAQKGAQTPLRMTAEFTLRTLAAERKAG
jgi:hypothetical protein